MHFNDYSSKVEDKEGFQLFKYYVTTFNYYVTYEIVLKMLCYVTRNFISRICNVTGSIIRNLLRHMLCDPLRNVLCNLLHNMFCDLLRNMMYDLLCNMLCNLLRNMLCDLLRNMLCYPLRNVLNNFV